MRLETFIGGGLLGATLALGATDCNDYLTVNNPNVVNAGSINPQTDATTLSKSAQQDFIQADMWMGEFSSFLVGESWPAETQPAFTEFGLRSVTNTNTSLAQIFGYVSVAVVANDQVLASLKGTAGEASNVNVARSALFAGYALVLMGEDFCQGVINGGPPLTSAQVLDTAIAQFTRAIADGKAVTGAGAAEAATLVTAAYVGRARAELQRGLLPAAIADAGQVPASFTYNLLNVNDPGNKGRDNNRFYVASQDRATIVVPPAWGGVTAAGVTGVDPRVPVLPPGAAGRPMVAINSFTPDFSQNKYPSYGSPVRLASGLEAQYIAAEAGGVGTQLALIQAQRAANRLAAYSGPTDPASVLAEFEEQRGFEFYLEGKRLGDFRRNGSAVQHVPVTGQPNFNPQLGVEGSQTCLPLPSVETLNNPNFKGS